MALKFQKIKSINEPPFMAKLIDKKTVLESEKKK